MTFARLAGLLWLAGLCLPPCAAQTGENVLVVVNQASTASRRIGEYYVRRRSVPLANVCTLNTRTDEEIPWETYESEIEGPLRECLRAKRLTEKILYVVTTLGVPLKIAGTKAGLGTDAASVDSELTLLYAKIRGTPFRRDGFTRNPFFGKTGMLFVHTFFPIFLVTRLAGWDFADVQGLIDRSLQARNRGVFVFDLKSGGANADGNNWLKRAADLLPRGRVVLDDSANVLSGIKDVVGYASWGSNDPQRKNRWTGMGWLPGAIATEYVSTNGRTFLKPPDQWNLGQDFRGSGQSLTADYVHEGVTGVSGHVYEPYLGTTPRPDILFPAYIGGRNLAESFYLAIPALSWQNIFIGDPLCRLGRP